MINNPKYIEEILNELEKVTLEELDEAIKNVDKEYVEIEYEYEEIYDFKNEEESYYLKEDYYDFYLHKTKVNTKKGQLETKNNVEVAV